MSFIHPNVYGGPGGAGMQLTSIISLGPVSLTHSIQWVQLGINVCSVMSDSATPWTVVLWAPPLSTGFFRQEYWRGLPFSPPEAFPDPRIETASPVPPALQVDSLPLRHQGVLLSMNLFHNYTWRIQGFFDVLVLEGKLSTLILWAEVWQ